MTTKRFHLGLLCLAFAGGLLLHDVLFHDAAQAGPLDINPRILDAVEGQAEVIPLTKSNGVTLNTAQSITGAKTFTDSIYVAQGDGGYSVTAADGGTITFGPAGVRSVGAVRSDQADGGNAFAILNTGNYFDVGAGATDRFNSDGTNLLFEAPVQSDTFSARSAGAATLQGKVADGASAVGVILNNTVTLANASAKLLSVRNNGSELLSLSPTTLQIFSGGFNFTNTTLSTPGNNCSLTNASGYGCTAGSAVAGLYNTQSGVAMTLQNGLTAGAAAKGLLVGSRIADGSVNATYQVLTVQTGISGTPVDKFAVLGTGAIKYVSGTLLTCAAGTEWWQQADSASGVSTAHRSRWCMCTSNGSATYAWQNMVSGTVGTTTTCSD